MEPWGSGHLFFYVADEDGRPLRLGGDSLDIHESSLLTSGTRMDVGSWQLHLKSQVNIAKTDALLILLWVVFPHCIYPFQGPAHSSHLMNLLNLFT